MTCRWFACPVAECAGDRGKKVLLADGRMSASRGSDGTRWGEGVESAWVRIDRMASGRGFGSSSKGAWYSLSSRRSKCVDKVHRACCKRETLAATCRMRPYPHTRTWVSRIWANR